MESQSQSSGSPQTTSSTARTPLLRIVFWALVVSLCATAVGTRFYRITVPGIILGDSLNYVKVAIEWSEGDFTNLTKGRVGLYALYSSVIRLFGHPTYSIKILNSLLDIVTIALTFVACFQITRNKWWALTAASLYALPFQVIYFARSEFPHAPCAFFVAIALVTILSIITRGGPLRTTRNLWKLAGCGLALGIASTIHNAVGLLGAGGVATIAVAAYRQDEKGFCRENFASFVRGSLALSLGYAVPFVIFVMLLGLSPIVEETLAFRGRVADWVEYEGAPSQSFLTMVAQAPFSTGQGILGPESFRLALVTATFGLFLLMGLGPWRRKLSLAPLLCLAFFLLSAIIPIAQMIAMDMGIRYYLNIFPVIVVLLVGILAEFTKLIGMKTLKSLYCAGIVLLLTTLAFSSFREVWARPERLYDSQNHTWIYPILTGYVDSNNRVLTLPYPVGSFALSHRAYFGSDALFMYGHSTYAGLTWEQLIDRERISYLYWNLNSIDSRYIDPEWPRAEAETFYGPLIDYTIQTEVESVAKLLRRQNARLIAANATGVLYTLKPEADDAITVRANGGWRDNNWSPILGARIRARENDLKMLLKPGAYITIHNGFVLPGDCISFSAQLETEGSNDTKALELMVIAGSGENQEARYRQLDYLTEETTWQTIGLQITKAHPTYQVRIRNHSEETRTAVLSSYQQVVVTAAREDDAGTCGCLPAWQQLGDVQGILPVRSPTHANENPLTAYRVTLGPDAQILMVNRKEIIPGHVSTASALMWSDEEDDDLKIMFGIARSGNTSYEGRGITMTKLPEKPKRYEVSHQYSDAHGGERLYLRNVGAQSVSFYVMDPSLSAKVEKP